MKAALWHRYKVFMHKKFIISAKEYIPPRKWWQRRNIPIFSTGDGDNKEGTYQYFLQETVTTKKEHTNIFYSRWWQQRRNIPIFYIGDDDNKGRTILVCSFFVIIISCRKYWYVPSMLSPSPVENIGMFLLCCHRLL
jgi:hypothetical protein